MQLLPEDSWRNLQRMPKSQPRMVNYLKLVTTKLSLLMVCSLVLRLLATSLPIMMARLIAESARLTVGYSVCCFVVIMGWLTHEQQLDSWIPLRLFWTAFGIIMALLSLRLFWPSRARIEQRQGLLQLLVDLGETLQEYLHNTPVAQRRRALTHRLRELRNNLLSLRDQRINALFGLQTCVRSTAFNVNKKGANTLARNLQRVAVTAWLQHKHGTTCLRTLFNQRTRRVRTNFLIGRNQDFHLRHFPNV